MSVSSGAWGCAALASGSTGTLSCTLAALDPNATSTFTFMVRVTAPGRIIANTATVGATTFDPNTANNTSTLSIKVGSAK